MRRRKVERLREGDYMYDMVDLRPKELYLVNLVIH